MAKVGDLLLAYVADKPAFFARIESIDPDAKSGWYQVSLLVLQVPLAQVTWILRPEYIDGASFTMGGKKVQLEPVVAPPGRPPPIQEGGSRKGDKELPAPKREKGKVISLFTKK